MAGKNDKKLNLLIEFWEFYVWEFELKQKKLKTKWRIQFGRQKLIKIFFNRFSKFAVS